MQLFGFLISFIHVVSYYNSLYQETHIETVVCGFLLVAQLLSVYVTEFLMKKCLLTKKHPIVSTESAITCRTCRNFVPSTTNLH